MNYDSYGEVRVGYLVINVVLQTQEVCFTLGKPRKMSGL